MQFADPMQWIEPLAATVSDRALSLADVGRLLRVQASAPKLRDRPFIVWGDTTYSFADTFREAERYARLFRQRRLALVARRVLSPDEQLHVGLYMRNSPAFLFAVFGAALDGDLVFGLNTGFRGRTLEGVLDRAKVRVMITSPGLAEQLLPVVRELSDLDAEWVLCDGDPPSEGARSLEEALRAARGPAGRRPDGRRPLLVIYTSGTTGVPKGILCAHFKLFGAGAVSVYRARIRPTDRGYVCMPLFHSNAWFLGVMPLLFIGGSFVLTETFSASAFEGDILRHGVTYMNYVGQPLHYILAALERKYGSGDAVQAALAHHPRNRFRIAHGNGASAVDREKLVRYLGMEHVYELYGSTEAVINTVVRPGDPLDSVGAIGSSRVVILSEDGRPCPPARLDAQGRIVNYDEAVGEICAHVSENNVLFQGYFGDAAASHEKYRDGYYHSGDLGHVRIVDGKRYLYFDGRTADWIRKDGENFSAESVAHYAQELSGVALAVAYGVPSPVSDELVCVAVQMREGERFDPDAAFRGFVAQQDGGGMDPKWMPDFVRVVDRLPLSATQKVLVRELKKQHFDLERYPDMELYARERGDTSFRRFTPERFAALEARFETNGRAQLLRPAAASA